jgi:hypothetical protein
MKLQRSDVAAIAVSAFGVWASIPAKHFNSFMDSENALASCLQ